MRCILFVGSKMPIFFQKFFYINSSAFEVCSIRANKRTMQRMPYNKQQNTKHEREEKSARARSIKECYWIECQPSGQLNNFTISFSNKLFHVCNEAFFLLLLKNCGVRILLKYTHSNLVQRNIAPNWTFIAPKTIFLNRNYVNLKRAHLLSAILTAMFFNGSFVLFQQ